jgi:hypothetical protein
LSTTSQFSFLVRRYATSLELRHCTLWTKRRRRILATNPGGFATTYAGAAFVEGRRRYPNSYRAEPIGYLSNPVIRPTRWKKLQARCTARLPVPVDCVRDLDNRFSSHPHRVTNLKACTFASEVDRLLWRPQRRSSVTWYFNGQPTLEPSLYCLSQSLHVGLQIEISNQPVQVFGVNSQKACSVDGAAVRLVERC